MFEDQLFAAVKSNNADTVRRLISGELTKMQYMNANEIREGMRPLDIAVERGYWNIAQQLLNCGGVTHSVTLSQTDINKLKTLGVPSHETRMFNAVINNQPDIVRRLISGELINKEFMNVNEVRNGLMPLDEAVKRGYWNIADQLMTCGGVSAKNSVAEIKALRDREKNLKQIIDSKINNELKNKGMSIKEYLLTPFQPSDSNGLYLYKRLNLNLDLTVHYNGLMPIPRAPFFHPYNPNGSTKENENGYTGIPGSIVTLRLPKTVVRYLPASIQLLIDTNKIDLNNIDFFFVTQNMPWKNSDLLFRPHYWVHGNPGNDKTILDNPTFNVDTRCRMGIFSATNPALTCVTDATINAATKDELPANFGSVSSHPGESEVRSSNAASTATTKVKMTISSPPNTGVMAGYNFDQTESVYSVALAQDGRMAITLHWLLSPNDQELLTTISHQVRTPIEFIYAVILLPNTRLKMNNGPLHHLVKLLNVDAYQDELDRSENAKAKPATAAASDNNTHHMDTKHTKERAILAASTSANDKDFDEAVRQSLLWSKGAHDATGTSTVSTGSSTSSSKTTPKERYEQLRNQMDAQKARLDQMVESMTEFSTKASTKDVKVDMEKFQLTFGQVLDTNSAIEKEQSGNETRKVDQSLCDNLSRSIQKWDQIITQYQATLQTIGVSVVANTASAASATASAVSTATTAASAMAMPTSTISAFK